MLECSQSNREALGVTHRASYYLVWVTSGVGWCDGGISGCRDFRSHIRGSIMSKFVETKASVLVQGVEG